MANTRLRHAFNQLDTVKQDRAALLPALLGFLINGVETVEVANRPGYVYARMRSNFNEVVQVINDKVSPVYNLPVFLVRDPLNPTHYKIEGRDVGRYENWGNTSSYLPKHAHSHSFNPLGGGGGDIVWVYSQQMVPWLVAPSGSIGSPGVVIHGHPYYSDSLWRYFGGTGTASLLSYLPTGTTARMVLVSLDSNGNPLLTPGVMFSSTSTGAYSLVSYIPAAPAGAIPLAGVLLQTGTSSITWDEITDLRPFFNTAPNTAVTSLDDLSDVVLTSPVSGTYLRYDGTNWIDAAGATGSSVVAALDDLTDVTLTATASGSSLQYNGSQWINRLQARFVEGAIFGHVPDDYAAFNGYGEIALNGQALRWEKESLPFTAGHVGSSAPTWAAITGSFAGYQFAVNNNMIFAFDLPLNWLTYDTAKVYIAWETAAPETANKWVKWQVEYKAANRNGRERYGVSAAGTLAAETQIPSGTSTNAAMYTEIGSLALDSNCGMGTTVQFVVTRMTSASGSAPALDPFGIIFGIQYRLDTLGAFSTEQKTVSG